MPGVRIESVGEMGGTLVVMGLGIVLALIAWTLAGRAAEVARRRLPSPVGGAVAGAVRGILMVGAYAVSLRISGAMTPAFAALLALAVLSLVVVAAVSSGLVLRTRRPDRRELSSPVRVGWVNASTFDRGRATP